MNARFYAFAQALGQSTLRSRTGKPGPRPRISQFVCWGCQSKFSTSSLFRQIAQATKDVSKALKQKGAGGEKAQQYPSRLVIYEAGDARTAFVVFWKATAMLQFGVTAVFGAPLLFHNEKQPNQNIRIAQAIGITIAGAIPTILMSYLTTPFVKRIAIALPRHARTSALAMQNHTSRLFSYPETRLEFTTLRAFPIERNTACFLFELKALAPQWWRFANLERAKTAEWLKRREGRGLWSRVWEVLNEPRFKFYVKDGRRYTLPTGVPWVWPDVVRQIQRQTAEEAAGKAGKLGKGKVVEVKPQVEVERKKVALKRQTARPVR